MHPSLDSYRVLAKTEFLAGNADAALDAATKKAFQLADELGPKAGSWIMASLLTVYKDTITDHLAVAVLRQGVLWGRGEPLCPATECAEAARRVEALLPKLSTFAAESIIDGFRNDLRSEFHPRLIAWTIRPAWVGQAAAAAVQDRPLQADLDAHVAAQRAIDDADASLLQDLACNSQAKTIFAVIKAQLASPYVDVSRFAELIRCLQMGLGTEETQGVLCNVGAARGIFKVLYIITTLANTAAGFLATVAPRYDAAAAAAGPQWQPIVIVIDVGRGVRGVQNAFSTISMQNLLKVCDTNPTCVTNSMRRLSTELHCDVLRVEELRAYCLHSAPVRGTR